MFHDEFNFFDKYQTYKNKGKLLEEVGKFDEAKDVYELAKELLYRSEGIKDFDAFMQSLNEAIERCGGGTQMKTSFLIGQMAKVANILDEKGLYKEADKVTEILKKIAWNPFKKKRVLDIGTEDYRLRDAAKKSLELLNSGDKEGAIRNMLGTLEKLKGTSPIGVRDYMELSDQKIREWLGEFLRTKSNL